MGTELADKSNSEIEEIAYKTWQDEKPNAKENLNTAASSIKDSGKNIYSSIKESAKSPVQTMKSLPAQQKLEE